jgi:hypothetical protein
MTDRLDDPLDEPLDDRTDDVLDGADRPPSVASGADPGATGLRACALARCRRRLR